MPGPTILQIIPKLDTGGAEISTLEIVDALVKCGATALVATEGGRLMGEVEKLGGEIVPMAAATKNPLTMWANSGKLAALIRQRSVGIIHARSRAPAWSALIAARRTGIPFVTTYHGAYGGTSGLKNAYNGVMARGDAVIANSAYTAKLITERHAPPAGRVRIIHRGVDLAKFDPKAIPADRLAALKASWGVPEGRPIILQAARLASWKGHHTVIEAIHLLAQRGQLGEAVVVMAGDAQGRDGYREGLIARIQDYGLESRILLPGHCADMPGAFALADLAVVASTEPEAFGRAVTEASSMGAPVIATDIGAPPETVKIAPDAERTGWLVPPGDAEALAQGIATAFALTSADRAALRVRARAHVAASFSVERMQLATMTVYDELLGTSLAQAFATTTLHRN